MSKVLKMTKEEADVELILALATFTRGNIFCPLLQGPCKENCECIGKPRIQSNQEYQNATFRIKDWYCDNAMFTGVRWEG